MAVKRALSNEIYAVLVLDLANECELKWIETIPDGVVDVILFVDRPGYYPIDFVADIIAHVERISSDDCQMKVISDGLAQELMNSNERVVNEYPGNVSEGCR